MAIAIGNTSISKIYLGNGEVLKIYLGITIVYESNNP
tara:strand:+ start:1655 stop:1765 length:111 start_codon:yes stop_codon:yes gene_type:complete